MGGDHAAYREVLNRGFGFEAAGDLGHELPETAGGFPLKEDDLSEHFVIGGGGVDSADSAATRAGAVGARGGDQGVAEADGVTPSIALMISHASVAMAPSEARHLPNAGRAEMAPSSFSFAPCPISAELTAL